MFVSFFFLGKEREKRRGSFLFTCKHLFSEVFFFFFYKYTEAESRLYTGGGTGEKKQ